MRRFSDLTDREINELIATNIFKYKKITRLNPCGTRDKGWVRPRGGDYFAPIDARYDDDIPNYSTNMADAWEVVEKLEPECTDFEISRYKESNEWYCSFELSESEYNSFEETVTRAICHAALKLREVVE